MKSLTNRIEEFLNESSGDKYECETAGRIEIVIGSEARSADVKPGDIFHVTNPVKWGYEGTLDIKGAQFSHNPGLSGKKVSGTVNHSKVVFLLRKENIVGEGNTTFWATWKKI